MRHPQAVARKCSRCGAEAGEACQPGCGSPTLLSSHVDPTSVACPACIAGVGLPCFDGGYALDTELGSPFLPAHVARLDAVHPARRMIWTTEQVDGVTVWRAETVHAGDPIALVVSPRPDGRWQARCGRGSTRDLAERGDLLTIEATADRAKACASGWARGA